jgi:uncharacterized coiled-coil protein SlyX
MITKDQRERLDYLEIRIRYGKASSEEINEAINLRRLCTQALQERLRTVMTGITDDLR